MGKLIPMQDEDLILLAREELEKGNIDISNLIPFIEAKGYSNAKATQIIEQVKLAVRKEMFDAVAEKEKHLDYTEAAGKIILMLGLFLAVFEVENIYITISFTLTAAFIGYKGFKNNRIAGIISAATYIFMVKFCYAFYISKRPSFFAIEIVIPCIIAAIPSFIIFLLISQIFKKEKV
jgi:hypothetical protein